MQTSKNKKWQTFCGRQEKKCAKILEMRILNKLII